LSLYRIDVNFAPFASEYKAALKKFRSFKDDLTAAFASLETNPEVAGDQLRYTADNVFKIRIGIKGQNIGKRGGFRLIYHIDVARKVITPLALYFKHEAPSMSDAEIADRLGKFVEYAKQPSASTPPVS
jgi:mRNA-degrading endonuclease RelE of RelBE toxin-antitoxin system